jgi:putative toxin-antitoxin system antitoxin component (TIGR02293 family)
MTPPIGVILVAKRLSMTSAVIAEVLGGKRVLGRSIKNFAELAELIRKGLPSGSLIVLGEKLDLKNATLSEKLGIPQRTFTRRLSRHSRLTAAESDRTVRLARVYATAVEMIGNADKAAQWLRTPNRALGGEVPIDQLDTDLGVKEVENILGRIAYGVYS